MMQIIATSNVGGTYDRRVSLKTMHRRLELLGQGSRRMTRVAKNTPLGAVSHQDSLTYYSYPRTNSWLCPLVKLSQWFTRNGYVNLFGGHLKVFMGFVYPKTLKYSRMVLHPVTGSKFFPIGLKKILDNSSNYFGCLDIQT
ncbi:hypothetical protein TNCV_2682751 [Trichonephila clavipes]|nr:hypothetical protein TNCV_2682751 [Trichonephila clavipes]